MRLHWISAAAALAVASSALSGCTNKSVQDPPPQQTTPTGDSTPMPTDPPAVPVCENPQLETQKFGDQCTSHDDCAEDLFCGAGSCRNIRSKITVCLEYAIFGGPWDEDSAPDGNVSLSDEGGYDGNYTGSAIRPDTMEDTYRPVWHHCERWGHTTPNIIALSLGERAIQDEAGAGRTAVYKRWDDGFSAGSQPQDFLRLVDQGCVKVFNTEHLDPSLRADLWISLWYP